MSVMGRSSHKEKCRTFFAGLVTHGEEHPVRWWRGAVEGVLDHRLNVLKLRVLAVLLQASAHPWPATGDRLHFATNLGLRRIPAEVHRQRAPSFLLIDGFKKPIERHRPHLTADVARHKACH